MQTANQHTPYWMAFGALFMIFNHALPYLPEPRDAPMTGEAWTVIAICAVAGAGIGWAVDVLAVRPWREQIIELRRDREYHLRQIERLHETLTSLDPKE